MKTETKETKTISFRLPTDVFEALQDKAKAKGLSVGEFLCQSVQENHQVSHEAIPMKDTVEHSKQIMLPLPFKRVFHFNREELNSVYYSFTGKDCLPSNFDTIRVGKEEFRGVRKIDENTWEVQVYPSPMDNSNEGYSWRC
jgi:hypothetical protein